MKKLNKLFSLGDIYVSDFIKNDEQPRADKIPLTIAIEEETGAIRLERFTDNHLMYGKYWYRSGINATMTKELNNIVQSCLESVKTNDGDVWLDIACNDGTLLKAIPNNMIKVGIDPVDDSYTLESSQTADLIIQDFFNAKVYNESIYGTKKPKIITCIAMFYDLDEPSKFLDDVYDIMDDEGLFVLQMSYTPLMVKQLAFDNICHEHVYYYTLKSIKKLIEDSNFKIVDCQLNDINGGSFRIYIRKKISTDSKFKTAPYRDVANYRIECILALEDNDKMDTPEPYMKFWEDIKNLKTQTVNFIKQAKSEGKTVWGYGASTKGNTLLQWFELDETLIDGIAERSPFKYGHKTVGTNIPIFSESEMRKANPDYLLILPWHFINEFCERESQYLKSGGKFIVPCPKFQIITSNDI